MTIGKGDILVDGDDVTIIACGVEVARAVEASKLLKNDGISARVVNMSSIKPLDRHLIETCARETGAIVSAEDHNIYGGLGGAVAEALTMTFPVPQEFVGVRDTFGKSGEPEELAELYGLTAQFISEAARKAIMRKGK